MKIYIKPSLTVVSLLADEALASDTATLGETDPIGGEISIPAGDWGNLYEAP